MPLSIIIRCGIVSTYILTIMKKRNEGPMYGYIATVGLFHFFFRFNCSMNKHNCFLLGPFNENNILLSSMSSFPSWKPFNWTENERKWHSSALMRIQSKQKEVEKKKNESNKRRKDCLVCTSKWCMKNGIDKIEIGSRAAKSHFELEWIFLFVATNNTYIV